MNPAVTIGLATGRRFPLKLVPTYVAAQILGACLGALATWAVLGQAARSKAHLGATYPVSGVPDWRALVVEALITVVLVIVVVSVATDERVSAATTSIGVGFALAAGRVHRWADKRRWRQPGPLARTDDRGRQVHELLGLHRRATPRRGCRGLVVRPHLGRTAAGVRTVRALELKGEQDGASR